MKNFINKTVNVTSVGFDKNLSVTPKQMEYDGDLYTFVDAGIACMVKQGESLSRLRTVSDGKHHFHLRNDTRKGIWTLLSIGA